MDSDLIWSYWVTGALVSSMLDGFHGGDRGCWTDRPRTWSQLQQVMLTDSKKLRRVGVISNRWHEHDESMSTWPIAIMVGWCVQDGERAPQMLYIPGLLSMKWKYLSTNHMTRAISHQELSRWSRRPFGDPVERAQVRNICWTWNSMCLHIKSCRRSRAWYCRNWYETANGKLAT